MGRPSPINPRVRRLAREYAWTGRYRDCDAVMAALIGAGHADAERVLTVQAAKERIDRICDQAATIAHHQRFARFGS